MDGSRALGHPPPQWLRDPYPGGGPGEQTWFGETGLRPGFVGQEWEELVGGCGPREGVAVDLQSWPLAGRLGSPGRASRGAGKPEPVSHQVPEKPGSRPCRLGCGPLRPAFTGKTVLGRMQRPLGGWIVSPQIHVQNLRMLEAGSLQM